MSLLAFSTLPLPAVDYSIFDWIPCLCEYAANSIEQERGFGIISCLRSRPAGPDVLTKSRANRMREATAEFNFRSTLGESPKMYVCAWVLLEVEKEREAVGATGCVCVCVRAGCWISKWLVKVILVEGPNHPTHTPEGINTVSKPPRLFTINSLRFNYKRLTYLFGKSPHESSLW